MSEGPSAIEAIQRIKESSPEATASEAAVARRREGIHEIFEALLLAFVAISTAFGGYQAANWDGQSAKLYGESSRLRTTSAQLENTSGQLRLYDTSTFNSWLAATATGNTDLATRYEARFRPEFQVAFNAWLHSDPFNNPKAAPGPSFLSEYQLASAQQAADQSRQASDKFDLAASAREQGDAYVRVTVFLAAVLFMITVSQRFRIRRVRSVVLVLAALFLSFSLYSLATFPHL